MATPMHSDMAREQIVNKAQCVQLLRLCNELACRSALHECHSDVCWACTLTLSGCLLVSTFSKFFSVWLVTECQWQRTTGKISGVSQQSLYSLWHGDQC